MENGNRNIQLALLKYLGDAADLSGGGRFNEEEEPELTTEQEREGHHKFSPQVIVATDPEFRRLDIGGMESLQDSHWGYFAKISGFKAGLPVVPRSEQPESKLDIKVGDEVYFTASDLDAEQCDWIYAIEAVQPITEEQYKAFEAAVAKDNAFRLGAQYLNALEDADLAVSKDVVTRVRRAVIDYMTEKVEDTDVRVVDLHPGIEKVLRMKIADRVADEYMKEIKEDLERVDPSGHIGDYVISNIEQR